MAQPSNDVLAALLSLDKKYPYMDSDQLDLLEDISDQYCWEWNSHIDYDENDEPLSRCWEARQLHISEWVTFQAYDIDTLLLAMIQYEKATKNLPKVPLTRSY